ncbi:hypothetical protein EYZ11_005925 [Aspergillus tanneri]|uniref:Uncharacterized protein n=1 Tax=Aspergillus tanneri TaxID=1220188 RepID=A0A4S3JH29_9EURO|nr:hypothetical protein EYZ11_005925 [Aspergillus tanneri]
MIVKDLGLMADHGLYMENMGLSLEAAVHLGGKLQIHCIFEVKVFLCQEILQLPTKHVKLQANADVSAVNGSMKPTRDHDVPRRSMIVPQAIMDRQASLHGQFGQVQELTLLVEELKRLRHQASFLDIARGPSSELWKEAEGIVKLATLDEDTNHSPPGSPSSLTFSFDDSEVESSNNENRKRASRESWQPSLSEQSNPTQPTRPNDRKIPAEANSVLDLIYQQRASSDSSESHFPRPKKLPFDTRSLRDLVVRAGVVTRALKEVIRKAEGVAIDSSNTFHTPGPSFSQIFNQPSNENLTSFGACYGA